MDAWKARLVAVQERLHEDDEEDELNFNMVLNQLGDFAEEVPTVAVVSGSLLGNAPNLKR